MPVTAQNITTKRDIVKELQYVTEGDSVTSPELFGVTPTSATFTIVGNNTEITINPDVQHFDQMVLGSEDIIAGVKTVSLYSFSIKYNPIDINIIDAISIKSSLDIFFLDSFLLVCRTLVFSLDLFFAIREIIYFKEKIP